MSLVEAARIVHDLRNSDIKPAVILLFIRRCELSTVEVFREVSRQEARS